MFKKFKKKFRNILSNQKEYDIDDYRKIGAIIGNNCYFFNCTIDRARAYLVEIGDNCTLTNCTILTHDASMRRTLNKTKVGCVKIGNNSFIGWGTIILPNVHIGKNCIIGAGSVVTKDIPDNMVAAGNPCKIISTYDDFIKKNKKNIENKPVFDLHYSQKSNKQKNKEKKLLENTFGYDE